MENMIWVLSFCAAIIIEQQKQLTSVESKNKVCFTTILPWLQKFFFAYDYLRFNINENFYHLCLFHKSIVMLQYYRTPFLLESMTEKQTLQNSRSEIWSHEGMNLPWNY